MKRTLASTILLFAMITSLNATEVVTPIKDSNCTTVKCKTEKKSDCAVPCKIKDCTKCDKNASSKIIPTWSGSADKNSTMKKSSCCKGEKKEESKKEDAPIKCGAGKCGGGK